MPFDAYQGEQPANWWKLHEWWDESEEKIKPEVLLRQVAPNTFQLVRGFRYSIPDGEDAPPEFPVSLIARRLKKLPARPGMGPWNVPPHDLTRDPKDLENSTDLASVPSWLWWFIASHGRHSRAALLHDHLIGDLNPTDEVTDRQADHAFRMALIDSDVPIFRRWLMWNAVSLASLARKPLGKLAVFALVVHLIAFVAAFAYAVCSSWDWLGGALARPFVLIWSALNVIRLPHALAWLGEWIWSGLDWVLPSALEASPWWIVAVLGLAGLVFWRKRWLITLGGLLLIVIPTLAVFTALLASWLLESALWLASKAPGVDVTAAKPSFAHSYREQIGRM